MASVFDVADYFIDIANKYNELDQDDKITQLRLHKLMYFAQVIHIVNYGHPLFSSEIKAFNYGPVVMDVYSKYKKYKRGPISDVSVDYDYNRFSEEELNTLTNTLRIFGSKSTGALVDISHVDGGPWSVTQKDDVIDNNLIASFYRGKKEFVVDDERLPKNIKIVEGQRNSEGVLVFPSKYAEDWD